MPKNGEEIYIDPLEVKILLAFDQHLYLTNSEIANILTRLANKIRPKDEKE